jgi:hypothetical protein
MTEKKGYILLRSKIQDHWLWSDKPFSKGQAWVDLLLMARWKDEPDYVNVKDTLVTVNRGQLIRSKKTLAERWGWSTKKVTNFLQILKKENQIKTCSDNKTTYISIVNYNDYQSQETQRKTRGKPKENQKKTEEEREEREERYILDTSVSNKGAPSLEKKFTLGNLDYEVLDDKQKQYFLEKAPDVNILDLIEDMKLYCVSKGKRYDCYYAALQGWARKEQAKIKINEKKGSYYAGKSNSSAGQQSAHDKATASILRVFNEDS